MSLLETLVQFHPAAADFAGITIEQLQDELQQSKGSKFVTLYTRTKPDLKKDAPFNDLYKYSRVNGIVNWHYGQAVRNQQVREGQEPDFEPKKRSWGTRLNNSPFVAHVKDGKQKLYLELKVERSLGHQYRDHNDATIVTDDVVNQWLKEKKDSGQPVEKEILLRDYDMDNIIAMTINGQSYIVMRE